MSTREDPKTFIEGVTPAENVFTAALSSAEPMLIDTRRMAKGVKNVVDGFDEKQRRAIAAAKQLNTSTASIELHKLTGQKITPHEAALAVLIAGLEKNRDIPEGTKAEFLGTVCTAARTLELGYLKNLRKAVQSIISAAGRVKHDALNVVNRDDFRALVGYGITGLEAAHKHHPKLFLFGSEIAEIRKDRLTGASNVETLDYQVFKARVNAAVEYVKIYEDSVQGVSVPDDVCKTLYAEPDLPLPELRAVTRIPVFDAKRRLISRRGYDWDSGLFYAPPEGFNVDLAFPRNPRMSLWEPGHVTAADVDQAIRDLADIFCDFEMDGVQRKEFLEAVIEGGTVPPSFLSCIAHLLEQPCRMMIDGPVMGLLISKTAPGAGGGLLANIMQTVIQGSTSARQLAKSEDERRKAFYTLLKSSPPVVFWDNLPGGVVIDSPALASLLTEPTWTDRELGRSGERSLMISASFVFVGNRPLLSDELQRRVQLCELLPQSADPSTRTEFLHKDLLGHVKANRAKLVRALIVLVLNWLQKGQPVPKHSTAPGSYGEWHRVVVGVIEAAAEHWTTWGQNRSKISAVAGGDDTEDMDGLLELWAKEVGLNRPVEASALAVFVAQARVELPLKLKPQGGECEYSSKSLGRYIKSFAGRVFEVEVGEVVKRVRVRQHEKRGAGGQIWVMEEQGADAPQ